MTVNIFTYMGISKPKLMQCIFMNLFFKAMENAITLRIHSWILKLADNISIKRVIFTNRSIE